MAKQDFAASPSAQPDLTSGELGEDAGVTHMRAFLKAQKAGDPGGMWTALKAAVAECEGAGYGGFDEDEGALGGMMG